MSSRNMFLIVAAVFAVLALVVGLGGSNYIAFGGQAVPNNATAALAGGLAVAAGLSVIAAAIDRRER